jgi:hypothetical protein
MKDSSFVMFLTPEHARSYKAVLGDYIGKSGLRITNIGSGVVEATAGDKTHVYKINQ